MISTSKAELHIWTAPLLHPSASPQLTYRLLSTDERTRAERLKSESARTQFVQSRIFLRQLLGQYLDCQPGEIVFSYSATGKPMITSSEEPSPWHFNLSHSGDYAVVALSSRSEVGIDLEQLRDFSFLNVVHRYFSAAETAQLESLPQALQLEAFFRCWTRKEAYCKGRGSGFGLPFNSFTVSLGPHETAALLEDVMAPQEPLRWQIQDIPTPEGYVAAVATPETASLVSHEWLST